MSTSFNVSAWWQLFVNSENKAQLCTEMNYLDKTESNVVICLDKGDSVLAQVEGVEHNIV